MAERGNRRNRRNARRQRRQGPQQAPDTERAEDAGQALRDLLHYMRPHLPGILVAMVFGAVATIFSLIGPGRLSEVTDLIAEGLTGIMNLDAIITICVSLAVLYGLSFLLGFLQSFILATVTQRVSKALRT